MLRYALTLLYAVSAVALGSSVNISKVNGSIHVDDGQEAGDVSTVNGSITVGRDARVREVETVNGSVRLEDRAYAESAETVNGAVVLGEQSHVAGRISAVNGAVTMRSGARVGGGLENVNGKLSIEGAQVGGGIETTNGDILVANGSQIDGGIHVEKNHGWGWGWDRKSRNPKVTVESGAVVNGVLRFERQVDLFVGAGATIGTIEGVEPVRHEIP
jgi:DUF4097 and DUF4098 domain-containing protein YvlB